MDFARNGTPSPHRQGGTAGTLSLQASKADIFRHRATFDRSNGRNVPDHLSGVLGHPERGRVELGYVLDVVRVVLALGASLDWANSQY